MDAYVYLRKKHKLLRDATVSYPDDAAPADAIADCLERFSSPGTFRAPSCCSVTAAILKISAERSSKRTISSNRFLTTCSRSSAPCAPTASPRTNFPTSRGCFKKNVFSKKAACKFFKLFPNEKTIVKNRHLLKCRFFDARKRSPCFSMSGARGARANCR